MQSGGGPRDAANPQAGRRYQGCPIQGQSAGPATRRGLSITLISARRTRPGDQHISPAFRHHSRGGRSTDHRWFHIHCSSSSASWLLSDDKETPSSRTFLAEGITVMSKSAHTCSRFSLLDRSASLVRLRVTYRKSAYLTFMDLLKRPLGGARPQLSDGQAPECDGSL